MVVAGSRDAHARMLVEPGDRGVRALRIFLDDVDEEPALEQVRKMTPAAEADDENALSGCDDVGQRGDERMWRPFQRRFLRQPCHLTQKAKRMLEVGAKLPAIEVADDTGKTLSTEDFKGRPLVLYFYPKDDTPG